MATLSRGHVFIMAITAGVCVANVYYSQPILHEIAASFGITAAAAGNISVLSQVGYGIGLFFLTPLGDMMERRKLILYLQLFLFLGLLLLTFSGSLWMLYAGFLIVGVFAVIAQVILPMAASLVVKDRGKIVGQIFTGVLIGILLARVFSGALAAWLGWRAVYAASALMVAATALLMQADFPRVYERFNGNYADLLRSTLFQLKRFPLLRQTAITGALAFGLLSAFWVTLTFYLSGPPFNYTSVTIGLFGFLAAAGALAAPLFGKASDSGMPAKSLIFSTVLTLAGCLGILFLPSGILAICVAVVLIDVGVQATQVTNIAMIYRLDQASNSRINTVYMTGYFIGGALGAYGGILCWNAGGWQWSAGFLVILAVAALVNVLVIHSRIQRESRLG